MAGWGKFLAVLWFLVASISVQAQSGSREPIRIGVIYSETGTMMTSEQPLVAATRVAVEEINADGGILGRRIELIFRDGQSDPQVAASAARRLIREDGVVALFGCWTSACRKAVMKVVEEERAPFYYPVQYEGRGTGELPLDPSPNVFYAGASPNQQIVPVIDWILSQNSSPRIVLIGSDYVYPRSANAFIRKMLEGTGAEIVSESYFPLGRANFSGLTAKLESLRPDVILNTVNGVDNIALFDAIARYDRDGRRARTISFSIDENQLRDIGEANFVGRYAVWNYFHDTRNPRVARFTQRYRQFGGRDDWLTSDPVEAAYLLVHLFAESARRTGALDLASLRRGSRNIVLQGFSGPLIVDAQTQHLWKPAQISRYGEARRFEPVWRSHLLIQPVPVLENMPGQFAQVLRYPLANREVALQMVRSANPIDRLRGYRWLSINREPLGRADIIDPSTASFTLSEQAALIALFGLQSDENFLADFAWLLDRFNQREQQLAIALAQPRLESITSGRVGPVAEAIYRLAERESDPFWRRTMLVALANLHRDGDSLLGRALERVASENPSVFLAALNVLQDDSIEEPTFYSALAKLPQREDFAIVPGLAAAFCATLDQQLTFAMTERAELPSGLSDVIDSNRTSIDSQCPQVLATYDRMSVSMVGNLVGTLTPDSPEGWLIFCFVAALIPVIAWNLIQGIALWIAPAWAIRRLRPFRDPPPWVPAFFHDAFQRVPRIGLKSRALDAWIAANRHAFIPASERDFYQDLVIELSRNGKRSIAIADKRLIRSLVSADNLDEVVRLAVLGEGGVGKSTLSEALLRVLSDNADGRRIGIFIEAESVDDLENVARLREAIRTECVKRLAEARNTSRGSRCEFENDVLMNELLRSGRLVVVLDDLSRALDQHWALSRTPEFEADFGAVVYTGRFSVAPFETEVFPQPLDRTRLAAFVESNVARSGKELRAEQRHTLSESLDQIFTGRDQVPALFAVLIAQHFVSSSGDPASNEPITIPALVLSYVDSLIATISPDELLGIEPDEFWRLFGALSWECISRGLRVSHVSSASAEKAISRYVDEGDETDLLDLMCERTHLVHRVRKNRVVVASDALAEYLAACWLFARDADGRWQRRRKEIEDQIHAARRDGAPPDYMRTFLQALRDVAESADLHAAGGIARRLSSSREALRELDTWLGLWKVEQDTIKVGILQSATGVMAISERPLVVAAKLAIERINRRGGVAGRMLEPVFKDGASSETVFAQKARELVDEGIMFIFGCWTSASRIEVLRVLNKTGGLLFYPVQYEGYEQDEHAIYFGAAPNQQIIPAIKWCIDGPLKATRFLSLGSDYIFPRIANEVVDATLGTREEGNAALVMPPIYVPLEGYSLNEAIEEIRTHRPDVILNLLNGSANLDFFWRLYEISDENYQPKVMSFSIGDHEIQRIGAEVMEGHYACWTYFCSSENIENTAFLRGMRNSDVFFPSDPAEAAYSQMLVFANAAETVLAKQGDLSVVAVREAMIGQEFRSPAGACRVHENGHVAKTPRIGVIGKGARYEEVWSAAQRVEPEPYPFIQRANAIAQLRKKLHNI